MAREIERKFLVKNDDWKQAAYQSTLFAQGYLNNIQAPEAQCSIRVRIEGEQANMNIKSLEIGLSRDEYEYPIPVEDAKQLLASFAIGPVVEKVRHLVKVGQHVWEVDAFLGDNAGLVVAEVELNDETEQPEWPEWIGTEVSDLARYYNVSLSQYPYQKWSEDEQNPIS